jgi:hypothetical protein
MQLATRSDGAITTPRARIVVHPTKKGWSWTQVSRNGSAAAVAPKTYDSKSNATRAAKRQIDALDPRPKGEASTHIALEVVDKDPNYV